VLLEGLGKLKRKLEDHIVTNVKEKRKNVDWINLADNKERDEEFCEHNNKCSGALI
jgi:hypothetical protein